MWGKLGCPNDGKWVGGLGGRKMLDEKRGDESHCPEYALLGRFTKYPE